MAVVVGIDGIDGIEGLVVGPGSGNIIIESLLASRVLDTPG